MEHFHFGDVEIFQQVARDKMLQTVSFKRAALRAFGVFSKTGETIHVHKWPGIIANRTFKPLFAPVEKPEKRQGRSNFILQSLDELSHRN
ncbi:MAG TPA: hypothetical protein VE344_00680 [Methylomirabilota bacterium]|nr:hypothetical protein [Methylomirabilota bacterium]